MASMRLCTFSDNSFAVSNDAVLKRVNMSFLSMDPLFAIWPIYSEINLAMTRGGTAKTTRGMAVFFRFFTALNSWQTVCVRSVFFSRYSRFSDTAISKATNSSPCGVCMVAMTSAQENTSSVSLVTCTFASMPSARSISNMRLLVTSSTRFFMV